MSTDQTSPRFTHMSIMVDDADKVEETAEFYEELLGFERLAAVDLGDQADFETDDDTPFINLRAGSVLFHIWTDPESETQPLSYHHFGIHVDNFEEVYEKAKERDIFARLGENSASPKVFDINGNAQMYLRDPVGNILEIDSPDIDKLDKSKFAEIVERGRYGDENVTVYAEQTAESDQ